MIDKRFIYFILGIVLVYIVLEFLLTYVPFLEKETAYASFVEQTDKIKKEKVDEITEYKFDNGNLYQTPTGDVFGSWEYPNFCIVQEYPNNKPVIKNDCEKIAYDTAAKHIEKTSDTKDLLDDTEATGKDTTKPFSSKKYFVGTNPNNYLYYSGSCYRVVNIAQNDTVKVVYEGIANSDGSCTDVADNNSGMVMLYTWDENKQRSGNFENASTLKGNLDRFYEEEEINTVVMKQPIDTSVIAMADWYIGKVNEGNTTLLEDIQNERNEISTTQFPLGLLNNSDYLKISCQTSGGKSTTDCSKNNYLYKSKYQWWMINYGEEKDAWFVHKDGTMKSDTIGYSHEYRFSGVRMAFYLKEETLLTGNGTENSPYRIIK